MNKMRMESVDITEQNIEKIGALFPNVITEVKDENGKLKKAINFELLKQMLSDDVLDGDEAYEFTWVGKKASIVEAGKPIRKTLRPCKEESKDWDTTENLYIEGDNLDVLKLLQESYLGAIKMIYIDPPYNTGNDFIYRDDYTIDADEYDEQSGVYDEDDNRLFQNTVANGRFHSDWCSMLYPRLILARSLLSEDGVIFLSIDDNEVDNLRKMCGEVFGDHNFICNVIWEKKFSPQNDAKWLSDNHDHILIFAKNKNYWHPNKLQRTEESNARFSNPDNDKRGVWASSDMTVKTYSADYDYPITTPGGRVVYPTRGRCWSMPYSKVTELIADNRIWFGKNGDNVPRIKTFLSEIEDVGIVPMTIWKYVDVGHNQEARQEFKALFDGAGYFDSPKPTRLIKHIISLGSNSDCTILDFFSGSATTAHAVMKQNSEDNGHRKFIMVQLPEECAPESEAAKAGYKNICEIGKERIRRAGKKIKEEAGLTAKDLDIGFRVLKLDSTNMKDVYYGAAEYSQSLLDDLTSNIKDDRTDMDLLYGCLLEWGLPLSLPHTSEEIGGVTVHTINDGDLIACFAGNISEAVIKEIAKRQPLRAVFRDSSFASSPEKINVEEIFKLMAPNTSVKVL